VLATLTPQQSEIIKLSFGIDCDHPLSAEEISNKLNISSNKVRRIKERSLKRLQHSKRSHVLRDLLRN
jgi:RNA polymerase sigma factor (sigma-70 family)